MVKIKLYVGLKIPDTTAVTAFHTLERLGYKELKKLVREDYYEFEILKKEEDFMKEIVKVDILVNANKHYARIMKADDDEEGDDNIEAEERNNKEQENEDDNHKGNCVNVLVNNSIDDYSALLETLKEGMGFVHLCKVSKGTLWKMQIDSRQAKKIAEAITCCLLYNEHYQEYKIMGVQDEGFIK